MEKLKTIKAICVKTNALDYFGEEDRNWNVEIEKEYDILTIKSEIKEGNHSMMVIYADPINDFRPSGFVPMELFEIDFDQLPETYHQITNADDETIIEISALSEVGLKLIHDAF
ncbi:hypothetical protein [Brumimicrobium aurantiacum]|uniref:Uncharacterized protein n=1 Tax=Brumimicrobium aurantiacum TaxID=1737063 RepID=A0A3E1EWW6_9FLAO|nr:hypothetical protein [Brumimicrobium aurantiacum]RFC54051.1 hypothetical protein DXU93_10960 [Brumimicrobium aurantiacum]